jgi:hypothetical protein
MVMDSWHTRQDHLAEHFRMGETMAGWKGDWGLEDAVLRLVQNSMPPCQWLTFPSVYRG